MRTRNSLEEKLKMVEKVLIDLKKDQKITGFLTIKPHTFTKMKLKIDFYVALIDGAKYVGRPLSITRNGLENAKKGVIRVSLFESKGSLKAKILEATRGT